MKTTPLHPDVKLREAVIQKPRRRFALAIVLLAMLPVIKTAAVAASDDVPESPTMIQPALIGSTAPNVPVNTIDGKATELHDLLKGKKSVLIFYRGGW